MTPLTEAGWEASLARWSTDRFSPATVGEPSALISGVGAPLPAKRYRGCPRVPLDPHVSLDLGDARALTGTPTPVSHGLSRERWLSSWLWYAAGVVRAELLRTRPWHRGYPSARALYPTDLYLIESGSDGGSGQCWYYHPLEHALVHLTAPPTAAASSLARPPTGNRLTAAVAANFGRTAHRYGDFAYRLCTQEAGLLTANLCVVATALGARARVRLQFDDRESQRTTGISGVEESVLALIDLEKLPPIRGTAGTLAPSPPAREHDPRAVLAPVWYPQLIAFERRACTSTTVPAAPLPADRMPCIARARLPVAAAAVLDLGAAIRERSAGTTDYLCPKPVSISADEFAFLLAAARHSTPHDTLPPSRLYCVVNHIAGLAPGVYAVAADHGELIALHRGDVRQSLHATYVKTNINMTRIQACFIPVTDFAEAFTRFGYRGYRMANIAAGEIAQRISLAAAALGLRARCSDSLDEAAAARLLAIRRPTQALMHVMVFRGDHDRRFPASLVL